jgi:hypothetical protein
MPTAGNPERPDFMNIHRNAAQRAASSLGLVLALSLAGCATPSPAPTEQLAVTTATVAHAAAAGAQELAPAELEMARDKLRRAHLAVAAREPGQALRLAQQAQVDAQLAESKSDAIKARKAADEVQAASRALREEMGRKVP